MSLPTSLQVSILDSLQEVSCSEWNTLVEPDNPFARHEFLYALEQYHCLGQKFGWYPQHIIVRDNNTLVGAMPMYIKDNSYGEFVFDQTWANAYAQSGLEYYPKLVVSIPYTPATGQRLLIKPDQDYAVIAGLITTAAIQHAQQYKLSSLHWLFTNKTDTDFLQKEGLMLRMGCQFHWKNNNYENFDHYVSFFNSKNRKKVKRERRLVQQQDFIFELHDGTTMTDKLWEIYHRFYLSTFVKKWGVATLSKEFFMSLGQSMPDNILVLFAKKQNRYVASAFCMRGDKTLYGRHWGCDRDYNNLHFELCYYQGLDYCIKNKLQRFEPGAQGEHKIYRGFVPTATWSAHWVAHPQFREMLKNYLQHEQQGIQQYIDELTLHTPFKSITPL